MDGNVEKTSINIYKNKSCKKSLKFKTFSLNVEYSETDLHFERIPGDSQGFVGSGGHGVILNHHHLYTCPLLQGYNWTKTRTELAKVQSTVCSGGSRFRYVLNKRSSYRKPERKGLLLNLEIKSGFFHLFLMFYNHFLRNILV